MRKIGASTAINTGRENWERMLDLLKAEFTHLELYNKITRVRLTDIAPLKQVADEKNISFSFHSMVQDLFCNEDDDIAKQEYFTLKGEIKLASLIGCSRVIFHIGKKEELDAEQIKELKELVEFANNLNIDLALENNSSKIMAGHYLLTLKETIPNLKFCIDIGHLNIAHKKGLVEDLESFVNKLSSRVVQLHVSSNDGVKDQHKGLDESSIGYFRKIAKILEKEVVDYVVETKTLDQAIQTLKLLQAENER